MNYAKSFGKKERVLNYACQTYQLSRPNKVGCVMALIRECQPRTFVEWESWHFENAYTAKSADKITRETLVELGTRLYGKITQIVVPEWQQAFAELIEQDCIDYIFNLTINRTYDGYVREKHTVYDGLARLFPQLNFQESDPELDHAGDVDFIAKVGKHFLGIQIKPITARSNFSNYSPTERMKSSFEAFKAQFGGHVFVVFSDDGEICNPAIQEDIEKEIKRLEQL